MLSGNKNNDITELNSQLDLTTLQDELLAAPESEEVTRAPTNTPVKGAEEQDTMIVPTLVARRNSNNDSPGNILDLEKLHSVERSTSPVATDLGKTPFNSPAGPADSSQQKEGIPPIRARASSTGSEKLSPGALLAKKNVFASIDTAEDNSIPTITLTTPSGSSSSATADPEINLARKLSFN